MKYTIGKWNRSLIKAKIPCGIPFPAKVLLLLSLVLVCRTTAFAGDAILSWDPNTESDLAGSKVYVGAAPGVYGLPIDVGNQTTHTVTGLGVGTFYFAVTAYDTSGNESAFSSEASKTFTATDTTPPVISAIAATSITSNSASITWTTNETSDTQVQYGTTTSYGLSTSLNTSLITAHNQTLTNLLPSTTYNYRVISRDAAGNIATSGNNTFTTLAAPDTTAPAISGISSSNITSNGATITWMTNETSDTQVQYGATTSYGSSTTRSITMVTLHSQGLTGLLPSTTYHFRVLSRDAAGNLATSGNNTFTTLAAPDTIPPAISGIASSNITSSGAVITWSTNEGATSQVEYGTTTAYGLFSTLNSTLVTSHSRSLSSLLPSTTYHYRVISRDAAGNTTTSGNNTFITTATPDTAPPIVSTITVINIGSTGATITWATNEAATSQVEYGTTTAYSASSAVNLTLVTNHSRTLGSLTPSTMYHFRVSSRDAAGNIALSTDRTFTTSAAPDTTGPIISGVVATATTDSATIQWNTDEPATTQVEYGLTTAYGSSTPLNATLSISHTQSLPGLLPNTLYHYRIVSADAAGNLSVSADQVFTTLNISDTTPPGDIQSFTAKGLNRMVQLSWVSPSDPDFAGVLIRYRIDGSYPETETDGFPVSDFKGLPAEPNKADHTGLQNNVIYYYSAFTYDTQGNYSRTARVSATPSEDSIQEPLSPKEAGGCGMILPKGGGNPPGPGDAADFLILIGFIVLIWIKKAAAACRPGSNEPFCA